MSESLLYAVTDQVAQITFNRPKAYNSFSRAMSNELQKTLKQAGQNEEVRAILITGKGKAFSAGQDLKEVMDQDKHPGFEKILEDGYNPIIKLIRSLKKPIIAAVNGVAAGAGANIALACDIAIASENASFIQAFSKIGLIPDSGGTYFLPRLIGFQKASALMMLGNKVSAQEAERIGLIYQYYPEDEFEEKSIQLAEKLAKLPTKALGQTKALLNQTFENKLDEQLQAESDHQIQAAQSEDYKEGVQAFEEKREPKFKGK